MRDGEGEGERGSPLIDLNIHARTHAHTHTGRAGRRGGVAAEGAGDVAAGRGAKRAWGGFERTGGVRYLVVGEVGMYKAVRVPVKPRELSLSGPL